MKKGLVGLVVCLAAVAWATSSELVELSAPVFPEVLVLYVEEGPNFPSSLAGEADLVHRAALTFPELITECAQAYPEITTLVDGGVALSAAELATNYDAVARCAYEKHTAKPYWIPQLVDDVDICANELGSGWRLPTEADVGAFTSAELQALQDTLSPVLATGSGMGALYFSMQIYVRGTDGTLKQASLSPQTVGARVQPLQLCAGCSKSHLESGLALRCIRRTPATP